MSGKRKDVDLPTLAEMTGYDISTLSAWCRRGMVPGARRMNPKNGASPWRVSMSRAKMMQKRGHAGRPPLQGTRLPLGPRPKSSGKAQQELPLGIFTPTAEKPHPLVATITPVVRLTKREELAGMAMQGMLACERIKPGSNASGSIWVYASMAVDMADALLVELGKGADRPWRVGGHQEPGT